MMNIGGIKCKANGLSTIYCILKIPDIDTLKSKLNTKFIEKLQYFANCVPGSDAYWRDKRAELISWIGNHVEEYNGTPSIFITLSCAEYPWKEIEKN
jgi:hypothetical protein